MNINNLNVLLSIKIIIDYIIIQLCVDKHYSNLNIYITLIRYIILNLFIINFKNS